MIKSLSSFFDPLPKYVIDFLRADFKFFKYLFVAIFLLIAIGINYQFNFETRFVTKIHDGSRFFRYFSFYGLAYFSGVSLLRLSAKDWGYLKNPLFWVLSLTGMLIVSSNSHFKDVYSLAKRISEPSTYFFVGRLLSEFRYFITVLLPLMFVWFLIRKPHDSFFGLTAKNVFIKPYGRLLLLMLPVIMLAAQSPSFLITYPLFNTYGAETYWSVSVLWLVAAYEFLYATAFLSIELFFRGFLVIGLARIMGRDVIIPMVCLYAFLHFEKPIGEAISSVFGGYLLGIFAFYSKNIWGGVFVHVGVALLMEAVAALAKM